MTSSSLFVLGATGALGAAITQQWLAQGHSVTALVRQPQKAHQLFGQHSNLNLVPGDLETLPDLTSLVQNHTVVFHGINYPYQLWHQWMIPHTRRILEACTATGATLLFPGNIYEFGPTPDPITESTPPAPVGPKGQLRLDLYQLLRSHAQHTGLPVIYLRLPDFFGPNVTNGLLTMLFGHAVSGKTPTWPIKVDIPHQFAYTPDIAQLFYQLVQTTPTSPWVEWNYGGHLIPSIRHWVNLMGTILQCEMTVRPIPKAILYALGWFNPVIKELRENFYLFEQSIVLDDAALHRFLKQVPLTPLTDATRETLHWFQNHRELWQA